MDHTPFLFDQVPLPYNGMAGHALSTLNMNGFATAQHVDPSALPLNFETSVSGGSPTETWDNYSEVATPRDDNWLLMQHSPNTSVSSHSPSIPVMDNFSLVSPVVQPMVASMSTVPVDEQVQLGDWAGHQPAVEGESARDHPYYKSAFLHPDGLYHCPWEGRAGCCHKPEKLKCNYDKFVDSHLKPYRCKMESCKELPFSSTACLLRHEREAHGMHGHGTKPYPCTFKGCDRAQPGNGFPRKWNLQDHMQRVHNAAPPSPEEDGRKDALKSRKRKSETGSKLANSRKSPKTRKASPRMEPREPTKVEVQAKLRRNWSTVHADFHNALPGLGRLDDPMVMMHINRLKDNLDALGKIHVDYMAAIKGTNMQQPQNLALLQRS
ncbi:hypothetical protein BD289DRAFT_480547 [Coniella lustricola]|uniref:C2H2-type domain-containing protein n=1 Tax=Coniella lustricola TaxID=2025994 RepID=A0A2T3AF59_9PEZI|nr:hypothetical protein BD289DRAFT_480547 [Coniella lustricola]